MKHGNYRAGNRRPFDRFPERDAEVVASTPPLARQHLPQRSRIAVVDALQSRVAQDAQTFRAKAVAEVDIFASLQPGVESPDKFEGPSRHGEVAAAEPVGVVLAARTATQVSVRPLYPG